MSFVLQDLPRSPPTSSGTLSPARSATSLNSSGIPLEVSPDTSLNSSDQESTGADDQADMVAEADAVAQADGADLLPKGSDFAALRHNYTAFMEPDYEVVQPPEQACQDDDDDDNDGSSRYYQYAAP